MTNHQPAAPAASPALTLTAGTWTALACLVVGLIVLFPILLLPASTKIVWPLDATLSFVVVVYAGYRVASLIARAERRLLAFTFWTFVYIWLGLAPFLQIQTDTYPLIDLFSIRYTSADRVTAFAVILLGLAAYEVGQRCAFFWPSPARAPTSSPALDQRRLEALGWFALITASATIVWLGGFDTLFTSRSDLDAQLGIAPGELLQGSIASVLLRFPVFVALYLNVLWLRQEPSAPRFRDLPLRRRVQILVLAIATVVISNPIVSARFWLGVVFLGLIFALLRRSQTLSIRMSFLLVLLVLTVALPYLDAFRRSSEAEIDASGVREQLVEKADYSMYPQIMMSIDYVERHGFAFGRQLLGPALFFVPRDVWQGKPVDTGDMVGDALGMPERLNQSSPLWAELYINGSLALVILGFMIYGYLSGRLDQRFVAAVGKRPLVRVTALVPLLAAYQIFVLRGSLLGTVPRLAALILITSVCFRRQVGPRS